MKQKMNNVLKKRFNVKKSEKEREEVMHINLDYKMLFVSRLVS